MSSILICSKVSSLATLFFSIYILYLCRKYCGAHYETCFRVLTTLHIKKLTNAHIGPRNPLPGSAGVKK